MLYELYTHIDLATHEEVNRMLPLVSAQRREQALRFTHTFGQFCCLKSYCMLQELVAAISPSMDGAELTFAYNEHGKPYLASRPDIHFSISHTKNAILVAVSNAPVGADVEQLRTPSSGLVERVMNTHERAKCADSPIGFTQLWTQKEAVLKLQGTGIVDDLHHVLSDDLGRSLISDIHIESHVRRDLGFCFSFAQHI